MDHPDVHQHRRNGDPDGTSAHKLQDAVESTGAKFVARYLVPLMLAVMAWQGREAITEMKQQRGDIAQLKSDMRVMTTRLDEGVVRQVSSNTQNIANHEQRIQTLERTVRTP